VVRVMVARMDELVLGLAVEELEPAPVSGSGKGVRQFPRASLQEARIACLLWSPQRDDLNLNSSSRGSNSCLGHWREWVQAVGCPGNAVSGLHHHDFEFS
jgi:hypothetical protein